MAIRLFCNAIWAPPHPSIQFPLFFTSHHDSLPYTSAGDQAFFFLLGYLWEGKTGNINVLIVSPA